MRAGEQLPLGTVPAADPTLTPQLNLVPGWRAAPTPWELAEQLDRIEAKLDRLLAVFTVAG